MSYSDLVNIEEFDKRDYFSQDRWDIAFYCKDCKKAVEAARPDPKWYVFVCPECQGWNIAVGTQEWIKSNYNRK